MIEIFLTDKRFSLDKNRMKSLAQKVLKSESSNTKNLSVVYCADSLMTELNEQFKGKNSTTDVLAFNLDDSDDMDFLGEIYINLQQAKRQAIDYNVNYKKEVERLTVHGILHLLGYSDKSPKQKKLMWIRQEGYLQNG